MFNVVSSTLSAALSSPLGAVTASPPPTSFPVPFSPTLSNNERPMYLPEHVVVLVHGNNGAPSDFDSVERILMRKYRRDEMLVIKSKVNHTKTQLGVDVGGAKLAIEIVHAILEYELNPQTESYKLSIIGHSLGGLYARFAIVQLQQELAMLNMTYVSFITLCTPHLGSRRPRAPSAIKNAWRLGVHTVLASKSFYGQTGIDLLVATDVSENNEVDVSKRPVLEAMSEPDSPFLRALQRFQHCTLVAMADGDVIVPFASASIRNYNPYPSNLLSKRYPEWRWHVRHHGFQRADLLDRLNAHVDESFEIEKEHAGLDVGSETERFASVEGYDCDNKHEVEFSFEMLKNQQQAVHWRRVDIVVEPFGMVGKLRLHDWPVNKMQQPDCLAIEWIDLLGDIIGSDHLLDLRPIVHDAPPTGTVVVADAFSRRSFDEAMFDTDSDSESSSAQQQQQSPPEEGGLRVSFTKWNEKWKTDKPIGDHINTFFKQLKRGLSSSAPTEQSSEDSGSPPLVSSPSGAHLSPLATE